MDIYEIRRLITAEKDKINVDFVIALDRIKIIKEEKYTKKLVHILTDFISIPSEIFGLCHLGSFIKDLQIMINDVVKNSQHTYRFYYLVLVQRLTNITALITGAISQRHQQIQSNISKLHYQSQGMLFYTHVDHDEQLIRQAIMQIYPAYVQKSINGNFNVQKVTKFFQRTFGSKLKAQTKGDDEDIRDINLIDQIVVLQNAINNQIIDQASVMDEIDQDARIIFNLPPARYPILVSPIERSLQYLMDSLELSINGFRLPAYEPDQATPSEHGERTVTLPSILEDSDDFINFDQENPFMFDHEVTNNIFGEESNNFHVNGKNIRPLFKNCMSNADADHACQRALFVLEVEGQILNMISILMESIASDILPIDLNELLKVSKFLSSLLNCSVFYVYGDNGTLISLQSIVKNVPEYNCFVSKLQDSIGIINQSKDQTLRTCLGSKKAYININTVVYSLFLLNELTLIKKNNSIKKSSIQSSQERRSSVSKKELSSQEILYSSLPQTQQDQQLLYIMAKPYNNIPHDCIARQLNIPGCYRIPIIIDRNGIQMQRLYLSDRTFNLIESTLAVISSIIEQNILKFDIDDLIRSQVKTRIVPKNLLSYMLNQLETFNFTEDFMNSVHNMTTDSASFFNIISQASLVMQNFVESMKIINKRSSISSQHHLDELSQTERKSTMDSVVGSPNSKLRPFNSFNPNDGFLNALKTKVELQDFIPINYISRGGYGCVVHVMHKKFNTHLAMKIMRKEDIIRKNSMNRIMLEKQLYAMLENNPNNNEKWKINDFVVRFYGSFKSHDYLFLVLELMKNGDLGNLLESCGCLPEPLSRQYAAEIATGLHLIHKSGIVYNDLKPENLLITDQGHLKFTDFGISKLAFTKAFQKIGIGQKAAQEFDDDLNKILVQKRDSIIQMEERGVHHSNDFSMVHIKGQPRCISIAGIDQLDRKSRSRQDSFYRTDPFKRLKVHSIVGTPYYLAPEVLRQEGSSISSDFWALGICIYEFLFGIRPFMADSPEQIFHQILNDEIQFPQEYFDSEISEEAKDLILKLLKKDPNERLKDYQQLLIHPWFHDFDFANIRQSSEFVPLVPELSCIPLYQDSQGDWVTQLIIDSNLQEQFLKEPNMSSNQPLEEQDHDAFQDFSFVNEVALRELEQESKQMRNRGSTVEPFTNISSGNQGQ